MHKKNHNHKVEKRESDTERVRFYWQMPNRVMKTLAITEGMVVVDFGSGKGYFTERIAERVGEAGKVYAVDKDESSLQILRELAFEKGLENIVTVHRDDIGEQLPKAGVDLILMVNVINLLDDFEEIVSKLKRSLKSNGFFVVVQWDADKLDHELSDWDEEDRRQFTLRSTLRMIYDAKCEVTRIEHFLPMQNIFICQSRDIE